VAEIKVTSDALKSVGSALSKFQRDTEFFPKDINRHVSLLLQNCEDDLEHLKMLIEELNEQKKKLNKVLEDLEIKRNCCLHEIGYLRGQINQLKGRIQECRNGISAAGRENPPNERLINALMAEMSQCEGELSQKEEKMMQCEGEGNKLSTEIVQVEEKLAETKKKRKKAEDKFVRLKNAYAIVVQDAEELCSRVNKYYMCAMDSAEGNMNGIQCSIRIVEEYLSTDL